MIQHHQTLFHNTGHMSKTQIGDLKNSKSPFFDTPMEAPKTINRGPLPPQFFFPHGLDRGSSQKRNFLIFFSEGNPLHPSTLS